jgi:TPR repeat protein
MDMWDSMSQTSSRQKSCWKTCTELLADIRAKAEKGDAQSQCVLGEAFAEGSLGVARNEVEAVKWFRKAAKQNDLAC